jgi:ABC-type branched-subunit amino acid transport system substrate-binding protein
MGNAVPQIAGGRAVRAENESTMRMQVRGESRSDGSASARWIAGATAALALALGACSSSLPDFNPFSSGSPFGGPAEAPGPAPATIGLGGVRVGLLLPLSAPGNAGIVAQSMRNAAELALAEFANPDIQLIVKDDGGSAQSAQAAAQAALAEGAEIIIGPLFSHAVAAAGQVTRGRNIPMIAFSTDASVAGRGIYLLSFSPESDVERVIAFAATKNKRSFIALLPDNAYGSVVEARFQETVAERRGRVVALERYSAEKPQLADQIKRVAAALRQADSLFIADSADTTPQILQLLAQNGVKPGRVQFIGTGLWDDAKLFSNPNLVGAWFAAPEATGYQAFAQRYKARFGRDPVRTASLAYDAVSLIAALVKTQGPGRFSPETLVNPSGFAGIDGVFRFKADGTSERGLAVFEIRANAARVISPSPKSFTGPGL